MDDILACRICLIMDVQMYNLRSSPLDKYFETLFGINPHHHKLLTYVCAECAVLINKFYKFREKCITGINLMQDMARNNIRQKDLQLLDRKHYKLASTISLGLANKSYFFLLTSTITNVCNPWNVYIKDPAVPNHFNPEETTNTIVIIKEETIDCDKSKNSNNFNCIDNKLPTIQQYKINKSSEVDKLNNIEVKEAADSKHSDAKETNNAEVINEEATDCEGNTDSDSEDMPTTELDKIKVNQKILNKLNNMEATDSEHSDPEETNNADAINEETTDCEGNHDSDSDDMPTKQLDKIKVDQRIVNQLNNIEAADSEHSDPEETNNAEVINEEGNNDSDSDDMPTTELDKIKVDQRIVNQLNNMEAADSEHSDPEETNNAEVINEETTDCEGNHDSDSDDMPTKQLDKIKVDQRIVTQLNIMEAADSEHSDPEETNNAEVINEETTDCEGNHDSDSDDMPTKQLDKIKVDIRQKFIKKAAVPNHYNPTMQINNTNILKGESTDYEASNDSDSDMDTMLTTALDKIIVDQKPNEVNKENYVNVEEIEDTDQEKGISKSEKPRQRRFKRTDKEITKYFDIFRQTLEDQIAEIKDRQFSASYQNATLRCTTCFQGFFYQSSFEVHMKKHHPSSGPDACEACGLRFRNRRALTQHRRCHKYKFVCKICHEVLSSGTHAETHRDLHTGVMFECKLCLETFRMRKSYMAHLLDKHPSQYICNVCGNSFTNEKGLNLHRLLKHKEITETDVELIGPTCNTCDIQFLDQEAFDRHLVNSSKHNDGAYSALCSECGISFSNVEAFTAHRNQEHPQEKVEAHLVRTHRYHKGWPKKCRYCSEMIPSARENWFHHRRDHPDKEYRPTRDFKYSCHICGYKSANAGILKYHMREKHSTERPHACAHCPKRFSTINKYKCHLLSHSDLRPYVCSQCSVVFKTKYGVKNHERTVHSGRRAFSCKYCDKAFRTSNTRYSHERYVHHKIPQPPRKKPWGKRRNNAPQTSKAFDGLSLRSTT